MCTTETGWSNGIRCSLRKRSQCIGLTFQIFKRITTWASPNLAFHIKDRFDMFLVELLWWDWPNLVIVLLLVIILPAECLWRAPKTDCDYSVHLELEATCLSLWAGSEDMPIWSRTTLSQCRYGKATGNPMYAAPWVSWRKRVGNKNSKYIEARTY